MFQMCGPKSQTSLNNPSSSRLLSSHLSTIYRMVNLSHFNPQILTKHSDRSIVFVVVVFFKKEVQLCTRNDHNHSKRHLEEAGMQQTELHPVRNTTSSLKWPELIPRQTICVFARSHNFHWLWENKGKVIKTFVFQWCYQLASYAERTSLGHTPRGSFAITHVFMEKKEGHELRSFQN